MKILVVGGGSMGRRRLRDLSALRAGEVMLCEPQPERCLETAAKFGVRGFTNFEEALAAGPQALVVSTPPAFHSQYVKKAAALGMHVFAEVPFAFEVSVLESILAGAAQSPAVLGVSHTPRYWPPLRIVRDLLQAGRIGKPLYVEYSLGNYLPDWHPYEDYRKFYGSDASMGGAGLDMLPFELNTLHWWFGGVRSVYARLAKLSRLEIKGPDNHDVLLEFEGGTRGFFHNDINEQGGVGRHVRVVGQEGTIEWHQNLPAVRLYEASTKASQELGFDSAGDWSAALEASREVNEILARQQGQSGRVPPDRDGRFNFESCYLREMKHFVAAISGAQPYSMATLAEEVQTVRVLHAILQSSEEHHEVGL